MKYNNFNDEKMQVILVDQEGYTQFFKKLAMLEQQRKITATELSKSCNEYVGDGWHDNPLYDDAMLKNRMVDYNIFKMLEQKKNLKIVDKKYDKKLVNIDDIIELEFIYSETDKESEIVKLTGKFIPDTNLEIQEVTLNSPIGKAIYNAKIGDYCSYNVGDKIINLHIVKRIDY